MRVLLISILLSGVALAQPTPPGGGYGIMTPTASNFYGPNAETITNDTDDQLKFCSTGGTHNECVSLDLDSASNVLKWLSGTGATSWLYSGIGLDVTGQMIEEGDGTYSWTHSPTGIATEGSFEADGKIWGDAGVGVYGAALDVVDQMITEGDGTYSWTHAPTGIATEGSAEIDGALYADGGATIVGLTMNGNIDLDTNAGKIVLDDGATGAGNGAAYFGADTDLSLYRSAANTWGMDGALIVSGGVNVLWIKAATNQFFGSAFGTGDHAAFFPVVTQQTPDASVLVTGTTANYILLMEKADRSTDTALVLQTHPTLGVKSNDATKAGELLALNYAGLWADHPVTDIDPHDTMMNAADAWSQATAGQRDGADHDISAGIRTLQIVCNNFAWAALDTVNITVNGVLADIIEGTDFAVGVDDDATCVALGAAIVTEAIGLTPDCTTLAGTCYLQPDQRSVHAVDSIAFVDGGADGVFATLTEGTDGSVAIHTVHSALVVGPDGVVTLKQAPVFADYTRHHDVPIGAAIVGAAAPGVETIGTFRCYVFDANADLAHISVEVPSEWNGSSDMAIDLLIFTDDGDILGNGEVIEFDMVYRSVDEGEAYDNGTAVTINATVTGGAAEVDKGQYKITAVVDYDNGNQPLADADTLGFSIMRDVDADDTYSGDVHVCRAQLVYTANALATH